MYIDQKKIYDLNNIYYNLPDAEKNQKDDILKMVKELQNNFLDNIWNKVYKQHKGDTAETKKDKKKNIDKYLDKLKKIMDDNEIELSDTMYEIRGSIAEINDRLDPINKKLYKVKKINKMKQNQYKKLLRDMLI